ncbi:hypothetical protein C8R45DRAFT_1209374, partial [Mycena sanguinolenta]
MVALFLPPSSRLSISSLVVLFLCHGLITVAPPPPALSYCVAHTHPRHSLDHAQRADEGKQVFLSTVRIFHLLRVVRSRDSFSSARAHRRFPLPAFAPQHLRAHASSPPANPALGPTHSFSQAVLRPHGQDPHFGCTRRELAGIRDLSHVT